mgnify:CR=1 FL=1
MFIRTNLDHPAAYLDDELGIIKSSWLNSLNRFHNARKLSFIHLGQCLVSIRKVCLHICLPYLSAKKRMKKLTHILAWTFNQERIWLFNSSIWSFQNIFHKSYHSFLLLSFSFESCSYFCNPGKAKNKTSIYPLVFSLLKVYICLFYCINGLRGCKFCIKVCRLDIKKKNC